MGTALTWQDAQVSTIADVCSLNLATVRLGEGVGEGHSGGGEETTIACVIGVGFQMFTVPPLL